MSNPFLDRLARGDHGRSSEKRVAASLGAKLHPASGALAGAKSDASLGSFRMEMKSTTNSALRLERGWLSKISQEAESHNQFPALAFSFVDESGKAVAKKNSEWVAIPMHVFKELVGG